VGIFIFSYQYLQGQKRACRKYKLNFYKDKNYVGYELLQSFQNLVGIFIFSYQYQQNQKKSLQERQTKLL
jgi:hypothetical protein